ncbi:DNA glycosylase AlkZ-like family protein [Streptomonospora litoralis]|uniref:Winged helix DNA-binding domain-containing protein n=1 Tax=Streptomonospora litoralis TaxID=2498135 RepID=A0A4P6Q0R0_9ACTN|nr:crosslink repair DNA glycosylase YcaQ family protein [Streptomonospora litoralis]QBI54023.1 hypothetical protein EKD16_11190 [Streptomonospora litoralis]
MRIEREQVHAWRLRRQFLQPRARGGAVEIVGRLCGVQAQVASAAETAVAVRSSRPRPGAVERALAAGELVKVWAMRGTLHVLPAGEAGAFLALLAATRTWEKPAWQRAFGVSPGEVAELAEAVGELLGNEVLTRDELVAGLVADRRFAHLEKQLRSGWGALLKPLAWQGVLCHGPARGGRATFTRPSAATGDRWQGLPETEEAAAAAIPAYLGAYGPATPEAFDAWLSGGTMRKPMLRSLFAALGDRLAAVEVEGRRAYIRAEDADELAAARPSRAVRLLGAFDQYVLGPGTKDTGMLDAQHRAQVSRQAGWISPVVVAGGRIAGVWETVDDELRVRLFPGAEPPERAALEAEAARLAPAGGGGGLRIVEPAP